MILKTLSTIVYQNYIILYCIDIPYEFLYCCKVYFLFFVVNRTAVNIHIDPSLHEKKFHKRNLHIKDINEHF